jgi:hypothetical protein
MLSAANLVVPILESSGATPSLYFPERIPEARGDQMVVPYPNLSNTNSYSFSNLFLTKALYWH